ncbi:MAG: BMC domain-containing protein [Synergistetes bacterium]|nr:BMC domain-containing protein [Synergistota bacterium]MCX8127759.1 BMC domain-containing protein [Synergistota bacterium]MDW8191325.1 BMC domain-containing protein [Synergistota bacterium]
MGKALGILESISIAKGIEAADAMVKVAPVKLYVAKTICPGKFLVMVGGDVAAVNSSVDRGVDVVREYKADAVVISGVHEEVLRALEGMTEIAAPKDFKTHWALGVIETFTVTACIYAADAAVKTGNIHLLEIRPAIGIGGKSFVTMIGDVSAVEAAINAGRDRIAGEGMILTFSIIPYISEYVLVNLI